MTDEVIAGDAPAKLNLALVVGPLRPDGKHEIVTVLQRLDLADRIEVRRADTVAVEGFEGDTIVGAALNLLLVETGATLAVRLEKRIPVAAGLGGGSSDAAATLRLGNTLLGEPVSDERLHVLAAALGADVPFFLTSGPQLGTADGSEVVPLSLPQSYVVLLVLGAGERKTSTADMYARFDARNGADGFGERRTGLLRVADCLESHGDLASLPPNDLAASSFAGQLRALGAFRADVTGAGPVVYGLFDDVGQAHAASDALAAKARTWVTRPRW